MTDRDSVLPGGMPDRDPGRDPARSGDGSSRESARSGGVRLKEDAPVLLRLQTDVSAPPEAVWDLLVEVRRWPLWHRGADFADLRGELEPGTQLRWRMDGMRIRSRIREVDPPVRLGWTMGTLGARGYQRWSLRPTPTGTEVTLEEAWGGLFALVLKRTLKRTLLRARTHWLAALRDRAEADEDAGAPPEGDEGDKWPGR